MKKQTDSHVRIFDSTSPQYMQEGNPEFNFFILENAARETKLRVSHYKYETLNNVCRRLGLKEFVDGNEIGWVDGEKEPYNFDPICFDNAPAYFKITFTNLTKLNMKKILGGK